MVFLFPRVLFRKFYFTGQFEKQFEQGNLLERFLWSLFLSFFCLCSVYGIFYLLDSAINVHPLENLNFQKISIIFKNLSKNEFPISFTQESEFKSLLFLLITIYFISAILGYLIHNIIIILSFDRFSIFKFKNNWHYLSQAYKENGVNKKIGDVHNTFVDVLVKNSANDELYRGVFNRFILDKENKLENLILSKAYKFISIEKTEIDKIDAINNSINNNESIFTLHRDYVNKMVYKKSIDGNLLVLPNENIININFTYVKISNKVKFWKEYFYSFLLISYLIFCATLLILPFLKINIIYLESIWSKIVFSITTIMILSILLTTVKKLLKIDIQENIINIKFTIFIIILFSVPYLWIFNLLTGLGSIGVFVLVFYSYSAFLNNEK